MRIALLEDDPIQAELVRAVTQALGHSCTVYDSGTQLMQSLHRDSYDLLLLDWTVHDASGFSVLEWARAHIKHNLPILFVSNHSEEQEIVAALAAGADDYVVKPVRARELMARISALLRRSYPQRDGALSHFGRHVFDHGRTTVRIDDDVIALKQKEFALAHLLFLHQGRLLSRDYLHHAVWGVDARPPSRSLDTHMSRVRTLLRLRPEHGYRLSAVYSHGYRLEVVEQPPVPVDALAMT